MHTIIWIIGLVGVLIAGFVLFYVLFYRRPASASQVTGLAVGILIWAIVLARTAPAGVAGL